MSDCTEKDKLEIELALLKRQKAALEAEISRLEKSLESHPGISGDFSNFDWDLLIAEATFEEYIINTKKLSKKTLNNYRRYLKVLRKRLEAYEGFHLEKEIYQIWDSNKLLEIKEAYKNSAKLQEDNKRLHNVFSAALNNFLESVFKAQAPGATSGGLVIDE